MENFGGRRLCHHQVFILWLISSQQTCVNVSFDSHFKSIWQQIRRARKQILRSARMNHTSCRWEKGRSGLHHVFLSHRKRPSSLLGLAWVEEVWKTLERILRPSGRLCTVMTHDLAPRTKIKTTMAPAVLDHKLDKHGNDAVYLVWAVRRCPLWAFGTKKKQLTTTFILFFRFK